MIKSEIRKDFIIFKKTRLLAIALIALLGFIISSGDIPTKIDRVSYMIMGLVFYFILMGVSMPMSIIEYDNKYNWTRFYCSTRAKRADYISAKFFLPISMTLLTILSLVLQYILVGGDIITNIFMASLLAIFIALTSSILITVKLNVAENLGRILTYIILFSIYFFLPNLLEVLVLYITAANKSPGIKVGLIFFLISILIFFIFIKLNKFLFRKKDL